MTMANRILSNPTTSISKSFLLIIALMCCDASFAQSIEKEAVEYFKSSQFQNQLYMLGVSWDRQLNIETECSSKYNVNPVSFNVLQPLKFSTKYDYPISGMWTFRYQFSRCGSTIIYNALTIAHEDKEPELLKLVAGTTRTSIQLLKDLFNQGVVPLATIRANDKSCKSLNVLNTEVTLEPVTSENSNTLSSGMWSEQWSIQSCNEIITLNFCFIPDGDGGTVWQSGICTR